MKQTENNTVLRFGTRLTNPPSLQESNSKVGLSLFSHSVISISLQHHGLSRQAPLSMGLSRQEYGSGLPFASPVHLPYPGIEPGSPTLQADSLLSEPPGSI